ncbi:LamG-like jellyroll fold domain-containing protein [Cellulomonas sp. KRMCY2]|uniref:LamG-like jellyroll fold domain-containing protein n=1 Tax=Cellulomonas sp. KRMCY2 TaxID=1304865 RepID=UPI00045EB381|nr:LamG-like jellyroll fold domain-containing protein [Cellulomonas sp. KRMCY2]
MRCSSTDRGPCAGAHRRPSGRAVLVVLLGGALGALAGPVLPVPGTTTAALTGAADVTATVTVGPCDPIDWSQAVAALGPVLEWRFEPASLRVGDLQAPGLLACDPASAAWDLAGTLEGGLTSGPVPLTTPEDATVALLVDATAGAAADGELVAVHGYGGEAFRLVVVAGGALELRYDDAGGAPVVLAAPALAPRATAHLVVLTSGATGPTLYVDGIAVAAGPPGPVVVAPMTLTVGAAVGSGLAGADLVVDEVLVLDQVLDAAAVAGLALADTW